MGEPGRIPVWWSRLSRAWRINVTLYVLACISLFALIVQVLTEEAPRRVEVANARRTTTTRVTPTTESPTTTEATTPETTVALTPEPVPTTAAPAPSPDPVGFDPSSATTTVCRNSTDPECGPFFYDPLPGNEPLSVDVQIASVSPIPGGQQAGFSVTVSDPDHPVTGNCGSADYGDQTGDALPCSPDPPCPPMFGPWDPPAAQSGTEVFTFTHQYLVSAPTLFTARFTFRTDKDECRDPYGSVNTGAIEFVVNPPPEGT